MNDVLEVRVERLALEDPKLHKAWSGQLFRIVLTHPDPGARGVVALTLE